MSELRVLDVLLHDRQIGTLTRLPDDRVLFAFAEDYVDDPERAVLSLSFKDAFGALITDVAPTRTRLPPFFANLLPEGAMRDYLAERARVDPEREFFLIWVLGRDLPGALRILPADRQSLPEEDDEARPRGGREDGGGVLRFSLAGVQLKFSAVRNAAGGLTVPAQGVGGSWIVKLPSTVHSGVPENEFAMMELARRVGIDVPRTKLVPTGDIKGLPKGVETMEGRALAVERFDRVGDGGVHIEDFAQVFGVYPERKYAKASYRSIAKVLWVETGEAGVAEFVRRLVFTALIGNGDMHLKNWSLIYRDGRAAQLSPAYDLVSTIGYIENDRLALNFTDSKEFRSLTKPEFARFAAKAGLPEKLTLDTMHDSVARFRGAWRNSADLALPPRLRRAIQAHLEILPLWKS